MPYMMHLKITNYWGSRKAISMCKTEKKAQGGAILHHSRGIGLDNFLNIPGTFWNQKNVWKFVLILLKSF